MARSPNRNDYFPPIKSVYEDSFGNSRGNAGQMMPYRRLPSAVSNEKLNEFEYRLDVQEKTSQQLIDKAIQIKQDLIENLNFTQGSWMEEKEARELLQEHIRTITAVMRQMNKDIKIIESHLKEKEAVITGTSNMIRQMETNQLSSISEMRGRIGRCDSVTAKLAGDIRQLMESIKTIGVELTQANTKISEKLQTVELKNHDNNNKLDRFSSESNANIRQTVDETNRHLSDLDNRTKLALDDIRHQINNFYIQSQSEREKLENKIFSSLDKSILSYETRIVKLEESINSDRHMKVILERLENLESDYKNFRKDRVSFEKELENRMTDHSDRLYRQQIDDLSRFKREVRDSFAAIYETVNMMQAMFEKKQKLSEETIRKEMAQLRKMVVLI